MCGLITRDCCCTAGGAAPKLKCFISESPSSQQTLHPLTIVQCCVITHLSCSCLDADANVLQGVLRTAQAAAPHRWPHLLPGVARLPAAALEHPAGCARRAWGKRCGLLAAAALQLGLPEEPSACLPAGVCPLVCPNAMQLAGLSAAQFSAAQMHLPLQPSNLSSVPHMLLQGVWR